MRAFLADNLTANELHVLAYATADAAWEDLPGRYPDALLLDNRLTDRQAHVLLESVRDPARAPVLALGAQSDPDREPRADAHARPSAEQRER
ncbi:MAG: hypothetical protein H0U51_00525, partial [Propionibacteriales bacterium]|nr:hypothetical protein [Propionibacteriales bacterium]